MGNIDRRGPEISDSWQGASDDGSGIDNSTAGGALGVAVIGAGVAGLGAAWHLSSSPNVMVTVLEAEGRAGGHAHTVDVTLDGKTVPVDTGFMVFNEENYPNMVRLFEELGVGSEHTDMSFSVSLDDGEVEWGSKGLQSLFARKRNALSPGFYGMLREMARFNAEAPRLLELDDEDPRKSVSVREYLKTNGFSEEFARCYLVPMAAALWSSTAADVMGHSALAMISFFHNHQMLQVFGRPQWMTPEGRSRRYVQEICRRIGGDKIELGNACRRVSARGQQKHETRRATTKTAATVAVAQEVNEGGGGGGRGEGEGETPTGVLGSEESEEGSDGVQVKVKGIMEKGEEEAEEEEEAGRWEVVDSQGKARFFDEVVFACPADTALGLLSEDSTEEEKDALGRFSFSDNTIYVHSDARLMPKRRAAWSAWNYLGRSTEIAAAASKGHAAETKPVFVTYWLNALQNLDCTTNVFVSLNPHTPPDPALVHKTLQYRHPQFSPRAESGQRRLSSIDGKRGLWFCGAWRGYGFHEDGLRSGLEAAAGITGKPVPWVAAAAASRSSPSSPTSSLLVALSPTRRASSVASSHASSSASTPTLSRGLVLPQPRVSTRSRASWNRRAARWGVSVVEAVAVRAIAGFLRRTVAKGCITIACPDGRELQFGDSDVPETRDGDGTSSSGAGRKITIRVFDWWFFVRVAMEYDLGLARSYLAGEWEVVGENKEHDGLRHVFLFFVDNRDVSTDSRGRSGGGGGGGGGGMKAGKLLTSWIGYGLNYLRYKLSMDNSLSGSRSNIAAHYDLSNELFKTFLDRDYMLYSSGIFHADMGSPGGELVLSGTLEKAQERKADALIARARLSKHHRLLDIGFGWGGISIRAAETIGCRVHGITLSKEQMALAEEKVLARGLQDLITFELVDYRDFAEQHPGEFDRIISCEMIEAVGHNYLGTFFASADALLAPGGVMVMQAITTPEERYDEYIRSTDFINTIIFPGSCCPSLTALLSAMANSSSFSLEGLDNMCVHYAHTLKQWRHRFNHSLDQVMAQGFDSAFIRCFNYYFAYCEAGFVSRTEGLLMLTFARPGTAALDPNAITSTLLRN
ncbi:unnamed protein product [Pylaiella littoralis]